MVGIFPHCDNSFLVISDTCLTDRRRMQCHELLGNGQSCIAKNSRRTKPRSLGRPVSKRRGNKQSAMHSATSQLVDLNFQKSMLVMYIRIVTVCLVMSPSQNFPAQAEPSYEGSDPSRAELGHFNFRAKTKLTILTICTAQPLYRRAMMYRIFS